MFWVGRLFERLCIVDVDHYRGVDRGSERIGWLFVDEQPQMMRGPRQNAADFAITVVSRGRVGGAILGGAGDRRAGPPRSSGRRHRWLPPRTRPCSCRWSPHWRNGRPTPNAAPWVAGALR